jgi:hypothetical protein
MADTITAAKTVVALFEFEEQANRAVDDLVEHGFARDAINVVAGHELSHPEEFVSAEENTQGKLLGALGKGLVVGGGAGALAGGVASLLVPVVGPFVLGGALATTFFGASLGGAVGGAMGVLMEAGVDESDARLFESALRHGGVVVTVRTDESHAREAVGILDRRGALDMDEHGSNDGGRGVNRVPGATNNRVSDMGRERSKPAERPE